MAGDGTGAPPPRHLVALSPELGPVPGILFITRWPDFLTPVVQARTSEKQGRKIPDFGA